MKATKRFEFEDEIGEASDEVELEVQDGKILTEEEEEELTEYCEEKLKW